MQAEQEESEEAPADRFFFRLSVVALHVAALLIGVRTLGDPDLPWHLSVGRRFFATHAFVANDVFSHTRFGTPSWHHHLAETVLYGTYALAGTVGLQLLCALVALGILQVLFLRVAPAGNARWTPPVLFAIGTGWLASALWYTVRPTLFSLLLLPTLALLIDRFRATHKRAWLYASLPLHFVWGNTHGFAVFGMALSLGFGCYALCCARLHRRAAVLFPEHDAIEAPFAFGIGWLSLLFGCLSHHGYRTITGPLTVAPLDRYIAEWQRTSLKVLATEMPWVLLCFVLVAFALFTTKPKKETHNAFDLALVLGTAAMALSRERLAPFFGLLASPWLARVYLSQPRRKGHRVGATVIAFAAIPNVFLFGTPPGRGFDESYLPVRALQYIERLRPTGNVWNPIHYGGYLHFQHPSTRVYIDGRLPDVFPIEFVAEAIYAQHLPEVFSRLVSRHQLTWALVASDPANRVDRPLAEDPRWSMVYLDDTAAVYVLQNTPDAQRETDPYRVLRHRFTVRDLRQAAPEALEHDVQKLCRQAPESRRCAEARATFQPL